MEIIYERKFLKDVGKIKDPTVLKRIKNKLEEIEQIVEDHEDDEEAPEIPGMTKLQGYDYYYRVRVGEFRLGISIEISLDEIEDVVRFVRCLHRKDIYRFFP
ncbi:MAG: type II toxin-antitoxin system RelE/ParE family toxin [Bacteroidota bacterium]